MGLTGTVMAGVLAAGCATDVAALQQANIEERCQRADTVVRDAQAQLAAMRAEMAATRIASAKQEAELLELRQEVENLRMTANKARKTDGEHRHVIEAQQARLEALSEERDQLARERAELEAQLAQRSHVRPAVVVDEASESGQVRNQVKALEASVVALTTQVQQLKRDGDAAITVKWGDTLSKLSRKYGVTVRQIRAANGLKGDLILAGQRLWIPEAIGAGHR